MAVETRSETGLHPVVWLSWAIAGAAAVQLAPNPLYVALVVAVAALVVETHAVNGPLARAFPALVAVGIVFALIRVVLTAATAHGGEHVLFTTPALTLPKLLGGLTFGGPISLTVVLQSAAEGFVVVGMMAVFGAFNAVVSHYELVQAAPRAFYEPGLVVTVALAFVPSTITAIGAVRDADRARTGGRVVRRGRLLRMVVPVLESGMERAVSLAESMDSRGFAHDPATKGERQAGWWGLTALVALAASFLALVAEARTTALVLGASGAACLGVALTLTSRSSRRTRYRQRRLTPGERMLAVAMFVTPLGLGVLRAIGDDSMAWSTSPLRAPGFNVFAGIAVALLAVPALRTARR